MNEKVFFLEERIKILTRDHKDLEQALSDSINVQEEMTEKENEYKKRIKELTAQLKHFQDQGEARSIHLVEENKKLKDVIYWLNDDVKQQLNANQEIKSQYNELYQDQANLKTSLVNYAKNEEKLKRNENMLENQIDQLILENSDLKSKIENHMQVCEEYKEKSQKEIECLRHKMLNMIDIEVFREVESEKEDLKKNLASESKIVSQLREKMEFREEEILKVIKELKQKYEGEINKMVEECDEQILIHAEALEVEREKFENQLKKVGLAKEKEIKMLKEKADEKQSEIEKFKISEHKKLKDANEEILKLEAKNQELTLKIDELEKNTKSKEVNERELSETIEKLLVEKDVIKRTLETQMFEIENANKHKDEKIRELSVSFEDVMKEKKQLEVEIEAFNHKIRVLEEDPQGVLNEKQVVIERDENELSQSAQEEKVENFENLENKVSKELEEWFFEEKEVILNDYRKEFGRANETIAELREKEVVYSSQIEELQEYLSHCVKKEDYEILQKTIFSLENENKTLKKDLDEVFDEFENLKQEQEKRFKRFSQIKNRNHYYELNGKQDGSIVGDRQAQLQGLNEKKQDKELMNSENDGDLEESQSNLRKEVQSLVNHLIEGSLELHKDL